MSGRGRGGGGGGGGRGRGHGGGQPSQTQSRGNAGNNAPQTPAASSSTLPEFRNLSISSVTPSPAPSTSGAVATGPVPQQSPLQQTPVQAPPAPVQPAQQQVATPPQSQTTVPVAPSSSRLIKAPARNGFGTIGKKCVIRANHFLVNFGDKDPHQYDVTITPEVISKTKSREILQLLIKLYKQSHLGNMLLAYDGKKSAFAAGPLPFESKEFVVKLTESNGREKDFKVNIKFVAKKDLHHLRQFLSGRQHDNPQETIQALDVVLREAASTGTQFGSGVLGDGIEYWKGFYQSLRPTQMGLSLNIDMSARAFYEPKLVTEFVSDFLMKDLMRPLSDQERNNYHLPQRNHDQPQEKAKGAKHDAGTSQKSDSSCYRCGSTGHWSRTCRTPAHLCQLYQNSIKGKEANLIDNVEFTKLTADDLCNDMEDIN